MLTKPLFMQYRISFRNLAKCCNANKLITLGVCFLSESASKYIIHSDKLSKQLCNVRYCERVHALVPSINLF